MKTATRTFVLCTLALAAWSCGPVPFERVGMTDAEFSWAEGPGPSFSTRALGSYVTDPTLDQTIDYYSTIGAKVGSYTPSKLKLWIGEIVIEAREDVGVGTKDVRLSPAVYPRTQDDFTNGHLDQYYADFTNPDLVFTPPGGVPTGHAYPLLCLLLRTGPSTGTWVGPTGVSGEYSIRPELVVDIPGYDGIFTSQYYSDSVIIPELSSGTTVGFYPQTLVPGAFPFGSAPEGYIGSGSLLFYFEGDHYGLVRWYDPPPSVFFSGYDGALKMPHETLVVDEEVQLIRFHVSFDVNNLVEVYDNNTPGDKNDDIVVFAPNFWERVKATAEVFR